MQTIPGAPTDLFWVKWPPLPIILYRDSHLKLQTGNPGPTWMVAAISKKAKQLLGAGVYHPSLGNSKLVVPNGAGTTNTIGRAELAAIAAAITHDHMQIATDSLTSLNQIRKQVLYPEKHRHHVKETSILSNIIQNSQSHIFLYKLTSRARIAGNECADTLEKYQACHVNSITEPYNVTCRLIMKAISKGSLAGCPVHLDAGSTDCLAQQNLQIPEHTLPSWLFDARLSARDRLTSSRPDAILVTPILTPTKKPKSPTTPHLHQVSHPRQPSRDVRRIHKLNVNMRETHLVEVRYC